MESPNLKEPAFRINSPTVYAGRVTCQICFVSVDRSKIKREKFQRMKYERFNEYSERWNKTDHVDFKNVLTLVDWAQLEPKTEIWAHKSCKGKFFQDTFISTYEVKYQEQGENSTANTPENDDRMEIDESPSSCTRETRSKMSTANSSCIICNEKKYEKGRVVPLVLITLRDNTTKSHKAEEKLKTFSNIHLNHTKSPYKEGAKRIQLQLNVKSLFAADVCYHRRCYTNFRSHSWIRNSISPETCEVASDDEKFEEFCKLVQFHVIEQKEVYTTSQLLHCYREFTGLSGTRSTDLRTKLEHKFLDDIHFEVSGNTFYILPSEVNLTANCIKSASSGGAISKTTSIRNTARMLHKELTDDLENQTQQWPPTPNDIIQSESNVNKYLFNQIAWIIEPNRSLNKDGLVSLSYRKSLKVKQMCQNLQSLLPHFRPSLDQLLLSLTLHRKTGSSDVIDILNKLGYGVPYTELLFVLNIWAEWASKQKTHIPSNIKKGLYTTHVADNIDWGTSQIHHTNSILIQHEPSGKKQEQANVHLEADYEFDRNTFRSFKAQKKTFPSTKFKRVPCIPLSSPEFSGSPQMMLSSKKTLCWALLRIVTEAADKQTIPAWSAFQQLTAAGERGSGLINVGYLPPITDTPTKWSVCSEIINRTIEIKNELELPFIFLECDQAIYAKVLQLMFKLEREDKNKYGKIILRMGGFHVLICMMRTIYSRFKGCGLVKLLTEIGIGGEGTIKKALKGGEVKEGLRLYKMLFEAILRSKVKYLMQNHTNPEYKKLLTGMTSELNYENLQKITDDPQFQLLPELQGPMSSWLDSFLEMVNLLLCTINFQRTGDWNGYLECMHDFLPYCFALNRKNYARYLSYYLLKMKNLKHDVPEAYKYLEEGGFSGSLTGIPHSRIPMDQVIEVTVNRFSKETGGLTGITQNTGASERWMRINHYMCALKECLDRKIKRRKSTTHVELGERRMFNDEMNVEMLESGLRSWVPNIWKPEQLLINMSSGEEATKELIDNVMATKTKGIRLRDTFFLRFTTDTQKETYFTEIKQQKVMTFDKMKKEKEKKAQTVQEDEGKSFGEIIINYDQYKLDLTYLLQWPITSKPYAFWPTSKTSSSNKHLFRNSLQVLCPVESVTDVPADIKSSVVDGMRVVRLISVADVTPPTFEAWAKNLNDYLMYLPGDVLHVVFDEYTDGNDFTQPPKGRSVHGNRRHISDLSQSLPKSTEWEDFLSNRSNKRQLVHLLADFILENAEKEVFVTKEGQCFKKQPTSTIFQVAELRSTHKEADHKIALHAVHASKDNDSVCVVSDDTDVYILLLFVSHKCQGKIYMRQGTGDTTKYHDVKALGNLLGNEICNVLPAFHALTGCDYTFKFFSRTKTRAFNIMMSKPQSHKLLLSLNSQNIIFEDIIDFVIHVIYNRPKKEKSLVDSRYAMIYVGKGKNKKYASTKRLPPDERSLLQKTRRANLVSYSYYNCLENEFVPMTPEQSGWMVENDELKPITYEGEGLPTIEEYAEAVASIIDANAVEEEEGVEEDEDGDDDEDDESDDEVVSGDESEDSDDGDIL